MKKKTELGPIVNTVKIIDENWGLIAAAGVGLLGFSILSQNLGPIVDFVTNFSLIDKSKIQIPPIGKIY